MKLLETLKKIPCDLGQATMKEKTKGKSIAFSYVPEKSEAKALDIGCRDGYWSKKLMSKGYEVESIDIEPHYEHAKVVDVNNGLPYEKECFDLIWCSEVLEHLDNPKQSIDLMLGILKQNGIMILTVPNSYFWLMKLFHMVGLTPQKIQNKGHRHFFTETSFRKILPQNVDVYGYFPYILLKCKIAMSIGALSPTFVAIINKSQTSKIKQ